MSEGVLAQSSFIDRNRFRSKFDEPVYASRGINKPVTRAAQAVNSSDYERLSQNNTRRKTARLAISGAMRQDGLSRTTDPRSGRIARPLKTVYGFLKPRNKLQLATSVLAALVIIAGGYLSVLSLQNNQEVHAQAVKLTSEANRAATTTGSSSSTSNALSTIKPTAKTYAAYAVAPNYPKYLRIPSIGVNSIVGQTGLLASGALGTPSNVYYTDWYTGSAEPGQPGATLIDGHVSSWTSKGVFFNLHLLKAGDAIQVVKGDNSVVNYQVVKTQVYSSNNVDMQAAITPVDPTVSGLNLITCTGQVIKGTSQFNERVIVFAKQV